MKNKKRNKQGNYRKLLGLLLVILILLGGTFIYLSSRSTKPASNNKDEQQAAEQADVDEAKKRVEQESAEEPLKNEDKPISPDSDEMEAVVLGEPTFSQANGLVNSSVNVSGATSGTCSFYFTGADGRAIIKKASLSDGSCSTSSPEVEFAMIGEYDLIVKFGSKSVSRKVNIV